METRTIFFIGKPGCGKGTQAKLLAEKTGWKVISAGSQFRAIAAEDTPVGRKIKSEIDIGILAPHWFAMYLYLKSLFTVSDDEHIIFDGFNRKAPEAHLAIDALKWLGRTCIVLEIRVSDEEVQRRLALRKDIEDRADDSAVDERLKEYDEYTKPAIEIFRNAGVLIEINGEQTPEKIATDISTVLAL
ncbi:MAG: nucleoside monophosphate kinase [Patescibacteria group bacterium]